MCFCMTRMSGRLAVFPDKSLHVCVRQRLVTRMSERVTVLGGEC